MRIAVFSIVDDWDLGQRLSKAGHEVVAWVRPAWLSEAKRGAVKNGVIKVAKVLLSRTAPSGRVASTYDIREWLAANNIPTITCANPNDPAFLEVLRGMNVDLMVAAVYPHIFKAPLLALPRFGVINYHPSLLPRNAGAQPSFWVLRGGETKTGITVHRMTERIDAGDILAQEVITIDPQENLGLLMQRLHHRAAALIASTVDAIASGRAEPQPQDGTQRTYNRKKRPEDHVADWSLPATAVLNHARALQPFDPLIAHVKGKTLLIYEARATNSRRSGAPGEIVEKRGSRLVVQSGDGYVEITRWEIEPLHGWINQIAQRVTAARGDRFDPVPG